MEQSTDTCHFQGQITTTATNNQTETKHCWVCFATDDEELNCEWITPCKCKGTAKWVHRHCLERWIDEKQKGNSSIEVNCPQCNIKYMIVYPKKDIFMRFLDFLNNKINSWSSYVGAFGLVGTAYWLLLSYGSLTVIQVLGHDEGIELIDKSHIMGILVGLPSIPIVLVASRFFKWHDILLSYWYNFSSKYSILSTGTLPRIPNANIATNTIGELPRRVCGGLFFPTIACVAGNCLYSNIQSKIQRTILGGITVIGIKGVAKIYYKHRQYVRQAHRDVRNYDPSDETTMMENNERSASSSTRDREVNTRQIQINDNTHMTNEELLDLYYDQTYVQSNRLNSTDTLSDDYDDESAASSPYHQHDHNHQVLSSDQDSNYNYNDENHHLYDDEI